MTWSRAKRSNANGSISGGVLPVAINSANENPLAGMALKPQVPQPVEIINPSTPVSPRIGEKSADTSQMPVHWRRIRKFLRNGSTALIFVEQLCKKLNVDCFE